MQMKSILFLLIAINISQFSLAQTDPVIEKIITLGKTENKTMHHLDILCNRFGGRLVGSDAYENAANWAASEFEKWGMEVTLDEAGEVPVGFNRGPWFGRLLSDNGMVLHFATPSYTSGTKGIQRGHVVIEPKTEAEFNRMKGHLKGAWVLISGESKGWPIDFSAEADKKRDSIKKLNAEIEVKNNAIRSENWNNRGTGKPDKELLPLIEEPAIFYKEMKEAGILGTIQSAKVPIVALYDRKNISKMSFDSLPEIPDIKLDENQYKIIKKMAEERQYFQLEFDIRNYFKPGPVKYHNVIGIIKGTEFPDEYVIVGAHLDAYDVATGGVDDGSGISPTMEAARLLMLSGAKPKRSIVIILFAAEEFGLLGSKAWIEKNKDKLPRISNMINRDSGPLAPSGITVSDAMYSDFEKICQPFNNINPDFKFVINKRKPQPKPTTPWGTDSGPFAVEGVPTIGFDLADFKGYNFSYGEIWHTERDLYNKSIPEYQEHAATLTALLALGIANLDHLLSREGYYLIEQHSDKKDKKNK